MEEDHNKLRPWEIKKLAAISDADSEVLADYVIALVKTDESESAAKANCVENLQDFLGDSADSFVDDVFAAIANGSHDPRRA